MASPSRGGNLIKNGQVIATFDTTTTPGELVITFTDANGEIPTSTDVDNILRQITYANSSDAPPASVQIDWTFDDGNSGSQGSGGALTATGSTTVNITAVDDSPQIDLDLDDSGASGSDFTTTWTQGGGQVAVADSDALITDLDSGTLQSLTVVLTNHLDGADERLVADISGTSIGVSYALGSGKYYVYLNGTDTVANYIQVLKTVTYDNTAASPTTTDRVITFRANDGSSNSNTAVTTLSVAAAANQAPTIGLPGMRWITPKVMVPW